MMSIIAGAKGAIKTVRYLGQAEPVGWGSFLPPTYAGWHLAPISA